MEQKQENEITVETWTSKQSEKVSLGIKLDRFFYLRQLGLQTACVLEMKEGNREAEVQVKQWLLQK